MVIEPVRCGNGYALQRQVLCFASSRRRSCSILRTRIVSPHAGHFGSSLAFFFCANRCLHFPTPHRYRILCRVLEAIMRLGLAPMKDSSASALMRFALYHHIADTSDSPKTARQLFGSTASPFPRRILGSLAFHQSCAFPKTTCPSIKRQRTHRVIGVYGMDKR